MSLAVAAALLAAPAAESPRAFVERLYRGYRDPDYNPLDRPGRIFAPPLVAGILEDRRLAGDEVGYMDADPLCQCQDAAGLQAGIGDVRLSEPRASARVRITFSGSHPRDLRLDLVRTAAGWRIWDIATADEPSLLAGLKRFNRRRSGR
jgi:hypothetical protein